MEIAILITFLVFFGIQLLLVLLIDTQLLFAKHTIKNQEQPPVSVIVAVHNDPENLKKLLDKLYTQNYPQFEIIVIDDRSDEDENAFLYEEKYGLNRFKVVRIEQTPEHISTKKYAITLGIKAAQYEHLLFTDADCMPASDQWIASMMQVFDEQSNMVLGVSPYYPKPSLLNFIIRSETFYTLIQYLSFKRLKMPYMGVGRNLAYRKSLFLKNKGFSSHQNIVGGSDDLFVNQNATAQQTAISVQPDSFVWSYPKKTWKTWYKQKKRHLSVGKYYKTKHKLVLGIYNLSHITFWLVGVCSIVALGILKSQLVFWVGGAFLLRWILKNAILGSIAKKMALPNKWHELFIFDFLYSFYIAILGIIALFTKTSKWS